MGRMLQVAYEVYQINVGLQGNMFTQSFKQLSVLLEEHWFFDKGHLCTHFKVYLVIHKDNDIPLMCGSDWSIMEYFLELGVFNMEQLCVLGRFHNYLQLIF